MSAEGYTNLDQQKYDEWLARQSDTDLSRLARNLKGLCDERWLGPDRGSINKHSSDYDPIAAGMLRHPDLTAEEQSESPVCSAMTTDHRR